jgi:hypothetical protein
MCEIRRSVEARESRRFPAKLARIFDAGER